MFSITFTLSHLLLIVVLMISSVVVVVDGATNADSRNAHFTMEFIPTFKNGLPHKCNPTEVSRMESFLGGVLAKETGLTEHAVEYMDRMYEAQPHHNHLKRHHFAKVRGFDFTFDCPSENDPVSVQECEQSDWCRVLCRDEDVRPGHKSLTDMASSLKEKLHTSSKTLEMDPVNGVKCLGHTEQLDFHLMVSVSPPGSTDGDEEGEEL